MTMMASEPGVGRKSVATAGRLPSFLIVGAAKSGTTTLWHLLRQHPEVYVPAVKEPWFFSHHYERGLGWYEGLFDGAVGEKALGEASVTYTMRESYPRVAERIARDLPYVKLIYLVRHPLEQIESMYLQRRKVSGHRMPHDFNRAIRERPALVDGACYARQWGVYAGLFSAEQMLPVLFEDLKADPHGTLARVLDFIGVDSGFEPEDRRVRNVSSGHTVDTHAASWLRRMPGFRWVADRSPRSVIRIARGVLKRPITERPGWTRETLARVLGEVRPEADRMLAILGKPAATWDLSERAVRVAER
ncbi:sulfotransferase [Mucisphaera sp.]|uniref:sulfotransferase n=1 Tax=Mucisphaera sp. TaxID=2913024 RepID=UPI003D134B5D